jgi:hypothetical protein
MKSYLPPLLRGIGSVIILVAAVIAFCIAERHDQPYRERLNVSHSTVGQESLDSTAALASEMHELRALVEQESAFEEVLTNVWFEWLSFAGAAVVAASFFAEAYIRRGD